MNNLFHKLKEELTPLSTEDGLKRLCELTGEGKLKFSSAFGEEDQVITHFIAKNKLPITVFTLDTGRLFQETYDVMDLTRKRYNIEIETYFPETSDVEDLVRKKGFNSFYESVENRKECCFIRKVKPLRRALRDTSVWITGLRAGQSAHRQSFEVLEWDADLNMIKYNPLLNWSYEEMQDFIKANKIPVNSLHKKGFASIGCAPCTRAIAPGEDLRAGRWWWENSQKECGLHETKAAVN
ncbi:MAG TPA: phosphoadenylyl-sulfate reductase [Cyclobacteriaceae bacterium]|nr:phosphoadenylyl-sulfate reductase [Cyclobacteriaceae bacterium]